jgi:hypothetical protein
MNIGLLERARAFFLGSGLGGIELSKTVPFIPINVITLTNPR